MNIIECFEIAWKTKIAVKRGVAISLIGKYIALQSMLVAARSRNALNTPSVVACQCAFRNLELARSKVKAIDTGEFDAWLAKSWTALEAFA
jgi:hypothetical protein